MDQRYWLRDHARWELVMIFGLTRRTAALIAASVLALIVVSASLLALAAREFMRDTGLPLGMIKAARATQSQAAFKLQGGSRILLRLDTDALREAIAIALRDDVRRMLREERIPFSGAAAREGNVEMRVRDAKDRERAVAKFEPLLGAAQSGGRKADIAEAGEGVIRLTPTEENFAVRLALLRQQTIEVIELRL